MTRAEIDAVVLEALLKHDPRDLSTRARWARRWYWKIDSTHEAARKASDTQDVFGLLAYAARSWLEAQALPEGFERSERLTEAEQFLAFAKWKI